MPRARPAGRRPSQVDVARRAGVSAGVVSAVINDRNYGSIRISDATRERVRAAVRELGYVPNLAARNLARGSSRLIGVFTFEKLFPVAPRNFYHEFLVGIEEAADEAEYNLLLLTGARDEANRRSIYANGVNGLQLADGALFLGTHEKEDEIARLAAEDYPFVFVGRREFAGCEVSYVAADYQGGVDDLVQRVIGLGHRRIAMLIPGSGLEYQRPGRRTGFLEGTRAAGLPRSETPMYALTDFGASDLPPDPDATATTDLDTVVERVRAGDITAVMVEVSDMVLAVQDRFRAAGLRVPEDVSVIGLHGGTTEVTPEGLTELAVPRYQMGQEATRMLLELLTDPTGAPLRRTLSCGEAGGTTLGPAPGDRNTN